MHLLLDASAFGSNHLGMRVCKITGLDVKKPTLELATRLAVGESMMQLMRELTGEWRVRSQ